VGARILVTGSGGFIGRNLCEQLPARGYQLLAPARAELDLLDPAAVERYLDHHPVDVVIHAATENATRKARHPALVLDHNLRMFFNLVRLKDRFGKLLHFGSGAEFDRAHWTPRMAEDCFGRHVPDDLYGLSKYLIALHGEGAANIWNLRLFGCFGPGEDWEIRFISNACCKAVWDLPITLRQNVRFDYLWVGDLVAITRWFIENDAPAPTYNVCSGEVHDLRSLADMVLDASGKQLEVRVAREGWGTEYSGDNARLLAAMGGFRFTSVRDAVTRLYRWYEARRDQIPRARLLSDE
jgi:UDP-glucose 4-epimerase